ncbi:MAG: phosphoribosylglycinamide formyltransferase [Candidatus Nitrosocaldus sp.]|nr:phosphoribosylglycinamide formyltransferase [Candidatus Nitrosocaldus sp.]MDW7999599.1 phosphoribosylglycinamide formyltransferase [Candidatus Nitrosocaldus sp.]
MDGGGHNVHGTSSYIKQCKHAYAMSINLAILVSGRGSNMEAILRGIREGRISNVVPKVVVSNRPNVRALDVARQYGVDAVVIDDDGRKGADWEYDKRILACLEEHDVMPDNGLVCLAGFMRIVSSEFVRRYRWRIMNIHPSLLPAFPGLHAQRQALEYGVKVTGCTVHFVDEGVDTGPIILQEAVEVREDDDVESLASRILEREHVIYVRAVQLFAEGRLRIEGRRVRILI